jgi:hypothetical protein
MKGVVFSTGARGACLILTLVLSIPSALGQPLALDEVILRQWQEYEEFSRQIQGTGREVLRSANRSRQITWWIRQNHTCTLIKTIDDSRSEHEVTIENPRYRATLRGNIPDHRLALVRYAPLDGGSPPQSEDESPRRSAFFHSSPHYVYLQFKLSELVRLPGFRIQKITPVVEGGREVLRVEHQLVFEQPDRRYDVRGVFDLDPGRRWCLVRADFVEESYRRNYEGRQNVHDRTMRWKVRHETVDHASGFPMIRSQRIEMEGQVYVTVRGVGNEKRRYELQYDYEYEVNDSVPDSEFTLSAFGLPEPVGVVWERRTPVYVWLLVAAGVLLTLGIFFRWLARRLRRGTSEG